MKSAEPKRRALRRLDQGPLGCPRGKLRAARSGLLSPISRLSPGEGLSASRFALRSRRRERISKERIAFPAPGWGCAGRMAGTAENAGQAATTGCHGAWQSLAVMAEEERLSDPPAVQGDQAFPMTLGGRLVVAPALGEGEAVMDAHLDLELAAVALVALTRLVEQRLELLDHVRRRELVVLGAGDVELALRLAEGEM